MSHFSSKRDKIVRFLWPFLPKKSGQKVGKGTKLSEKVGKFYSISRKNIQIGYSFCLQISKSWSTRGQNCPLSHLLTVFSDTPTRFPKDICVSSPRNFFNFSPIVKQIHLLKISISPFSLTFWHSF